MSSRSISLHLLANDSFYRSDPGTRVFFGAMSYGSCIQKDFDGEKKKNNKRQGAAEKVYMWRPHMTINISIAASATPSPSPAPSFTINIRLWLLHTALPLFEGQTWAQSITGLSLPSWPASRYLVFTIRHHPASQAAQPAQHPIIHSGCR